MSDAHREFVELMPWYVNGTLNMSDRRALRAHLGECLSCRAALRAEVRLYELVRSQDVDPLGARHGVGELHRRIARHGSRSRRHASRWTPAAGYAVAAAFAGAIVWMSLVVSPDPARDASDAPFSTLSDVSQAAPNRIDVVFAVAPDAAELERFLADIDGSVVSGPSDIGRYTIDVEPASSIDDLLDALRDDSRIRFAGRSYGLAGPESEASP